jgi:DNA processing protein
MTESLSRPELAAWLRLTTAPGIGARTARQLLTAFGPPENILAQPRGALAERIGRAGAEVLLAPADDLDVHVETAWQWLRDASVGPRHICPLGDPLYPAALLDTEDPPTLLYMTGRLDALPSGWSPALAVVGSRNPTPQGTEHARQFSRDLASRGLCIVSGLALGVDAAAHEGALAGAAPERLATVAVVGTGLDRVYPARHRELAHRIAARGLIISEYPLGTPPLAANFPRRNRLIAGLCQGTLVVEAALESGSLITARLAVEQGREVFAIPGSIHSPQSRGCHVLIRQGAKLVESSEDVLEDLRIDAAPASRGADDTTDSSGTPPEDALLAALGHEVSSLDALQARTGLPAAELQARLLALELDGLVGRLPGGRFQRQHRA